MYVFIPPETNWSLWSRVQLRAIVDVIHIAVAISHIFKSHRLTVYRHVHVRSSYKQWSKDSNEEQFLEDPCDPNAHGK